MILPFVGIVLGYVCFYTGDTGGGGGGRSKTKNRRSSVLGPKTSKTEAMAASSRRCAGWTRQTLTWASSSRPRYLTGFTHGFMRDFCCCVGCSDMPPQGRVNLLQGFVVLNGGIPLTTRPEHCHI